MLDAGTNAGPSVQETMQSSRAVAVYWAQSADILVALLEKALVFY